MHRRLASLLPRFNLFHFLVGKDQDRRRFLGAVQPVILSDEHDRLLLPEWFTLFTHGSTEIRDAADAAQSLRPLGGQYTFILFSVGLLNASLFAASILPPSTAYTVSQALGFESGLNKRHR
jgi:Natural resistance-associated macrophage protein